MSILNKSIRNGIYLGIPFPLITFFYGFLYNEIFKGIYEFTIGGLVYVLLVCFFIFMIIFMIGFSISLIYYYYKEKITNVKQ